MRRLARRGIPARSGSRRLAAAAAARRGEAAAWAAAKPLPGAASGTSALDDEVGVVMRHVHLLPPEQADAVGEGLVPACHDVAVRVVVLAGAHPGLHLRAGREAEGFRQAFLEALRELLPALLHAPPDEDDPVLPGVAVRPGRGEGLVPQHVDALDDQLLLAPRDVQHGLNPQEVLGLLLRAQVLIQELLEEVHAHGAGASDAHIGDGAVHLRLHPLGAEQLLIHMLLLEHLGETESANVEELLDGHDGVPTPDYLRFRVELLHSALDVGQLLLTRQVDLVDQNRAGERDLGARRALRLRVALALVQLFDGMLRVDEGHDVVDGEGLLDVRVHKEGLDHGRRIGHARQLYEHPVQVESVCVPLCDAAQGFHEVLADRAADAPVVKQDQLSCQVRVLLLDQRVIDADLANLVLDHGKLLVPLLPQQVVEQRGLPGAEVPR
mmetsp:Transcript_84839/g.252882  ORF Transcript_84839/g.252882 Transcript_84839/m.252882 type:complete len:439 (-) Transcript_84839:84-1400(-)